MAFLIASADLKASGKLDATPDPHLVFAIPSADLKDATAVGSIDATAAMVFASVAADLAAKGKLDATPDPHLVFTIPTADLIAKGKLDATPDPHMIFTAPTADLSNATPPAAPRVLYIRRLAGVHY